MFRKVGRRVRVDFQLDLERFCAVPESAAGSPTAPLAQSAGGTRYRLVGVVEHQGSMMRCALSLNSSTSIASVHHSTDRLHLVTFTLSVGCL